MSEFNFNSQVCTSREQSERLLALGLKKETADMTIIGVFIGNNEDGTLAFDDVPNAHPPMLKKDIPAWSLHRLIEMCDVVIRVFKKRISLSSGEGFNAEETLYDNLINCIEWLIKKGYFNKEYLV